MSKKQLDSTNIRIKLTTKEKLDSIPFPKSTYDDIINKALDVLLKELKKWLLNNYLRMLQNNIKIRGVKNNERKK